MIKIRSKENIVFVAPALNSFIRNDINILTQEYNVIVNIYNWKHKIYTPWFILRQFFFMFSKIWRTKKIVIHFGGYWSLIPTLIGKIFKVPVFIVLHGTDCADINPINYGSLRKAWIKRFCRVSYKQATLLLPVSHSLIEVKNTFFSDDKYSYQGYKNFFPNIKTPNKVIYNGNDHNFWKSDPTIKKVPNTFVAVFSETQFILKGGELIIELAGYYPDFIFYMAGSKAPDGLKNIPQNVIFLGHISQEELKMYYSKSQFVFQLSIFEGFGLALCEAMLCECIPIGSSVNMIPEIIGDSGFILKKRNVHELGRLIEEILLIEKVEEYGQKARERIIDNYSIDRRRHELLSTINKTDAN